MMINGISPIDYRSVGNRCVFAPGSSYSFFDVFEGREDSDLRRERLSYLKSKGFQIIHVDVVSEARRRVGVSKWKLGAKLCDAPDFFNCSGLTRWVYAQKGIWLPRLARRQYDITGIEGGWGKIAFISTKLEGERAGDLLFVSSPYSNGVRTEQHDKLHVCLVTGNKTVICATNSELGVGVVEISYGKLFKTREFRGVGRVVDQSEKLVTLSIPQGMEIETSLDVLHLLPKSLAVRRE